MHLKESSNHKIFPALVAACCGIVRWHRKSCQMARGQLVAASTKRLSGGVYYEAKKKTSSLNVLSR